VRLRLSTRQTPLSVHFENRTISAGSPQADNVRDGGPGEGCIATVTYKIKHAEADYGHLTS
jgi:hypothetical protein